MALKDNPHDMKAPYHPGQLIRVTTPEEVFEGKVTLCNRVGFTDAWLLSMEGSHFSYVVVGKEPKLANNAHPIELLDESFNLNTPLVRPERKSILTTEFNDTTMIVQNIPRVVHNLTWMELKKALSREEFSAWTLSDGSQVVGQFKNGNIACVWMLEGFEPLG